MKNIADNSTSPINSTKPLKLAKIPTENEILQRLAKRETLPVAFRINELTYSALDLYTRHNRVSMSALENALHDAFVEQQMKEHELLYGLECCQRNAFNLFLERLGTKMAKMSEAEIVEEYLSGYIDDIVHFAGDEEVGALDKLGRKEKCQRFMAEFFPEHYAYIPWESSACNLGVTIDADAVDEVELSELRGVDDDDREEYEKELEDDFLIYVPPTKWAITLAVLRVGQEKLKQLYGRELYIFDDYKQKYRLGDPREIADVIAKTPVEELAQKLTQKLKLPLIWDEDEED